MTWDDLWVCDGVVTDPIYNELSNWDELIDGKGCVCAPGFIDLQVNGAFGIDFTLPSDDVA